MSRSRVALTIALLTLAACSDDPTGPDADAETRQQSLELASTAGQAIATDVMFAQGDMYAAGATTSGGDGARVGAGCTWSAASGSWTCQASRENGLTVTRTITFYAGGATQQRYDAATTDSIRINASAAGTLTRDGRAMTISRSRNAVISGLTGAETRRTVNATGNGTRHSQFTHDGITRTFAETVSHVENDVVLPVGGGYPLSGTVTHNVSATFTATGRRTESRSVQRNVTVTFNGTAIVPMTVGTMSCTLNLDTRRVSCGR